MYRNLPWVNLNQELKLGPASWKYLPDQLPPKQDILLLQCLEKGKVTFVIGYLNNSEEVAFFYKEDTYYPVYNVQAYILLKS